MAAPGCFADSLHEQDGCRYKWLWLNTFSLLSGLFFFRESRSSPVPQTSEAWVFSRVGQHCNYKCLECQFDLSANWLGRGPMLDEIPVTVPSGVSRPTACLYLSVTVWMVVCLCQRCDWQATSPGSIPPLDPYQMGLTPALLHPCNRWRNGWMIALRLKLVDKLFHLPTKPIRVYVYLSPSLFRFEPVSPVAPAELRVDPKFGC